VPAISAARLAVHLADAALVPAEQLVSEVALSVQMTFGRMISILPPQVRSAGVDLLGRGCRLLGGRL
jgi:hypothetical protein